MSLSVKLTVIFLGIILLTGLVSFYGTYNFQTEILEREITEKLEEVASTRLDRLDRTFYEGFVDMDRLSTDPRITSKNAVPTQIQEALEAFQAAHKQYAGISFFNADKASIATTGPLYATDGQNASLVRYWPSILAGENHVVNVSKSGVGQIPMIHLVNRVEDDKGGFAGVLVAEFPVQELYAILQGNSKYSDDNSKYRIDILDKNGLVMYSNHEKDAILEEVDDDFEIINSRLMSARSVGSMTHVHESSRGGGQGRKDLMAFARELGYQTFKGNGWILMVEYGAKSAFAPIGILGRKVLFLLTAVSIVSALLILFVLMFTVIHPLKKLSEASTRLGEGDMSARVAINSKDEIGRLAGAFNEMARNLKGAKERLAEAAEAALERANMAERRIISISEDTQQKIGQELHDDLGQHLTGVAFMAEALSQRLKGLSPPDADGALRITTLINEAIIKTRKLAQGLYPVELKESGLHAMLGKYPDDLEMTYGIKCCYICEGNYPIDDPDVTIHLFRIAQEAINNAVKHSGATEVILKFMSTPTIITLEIADNGQGMGAAAAGLQPGLGMHTMRYRASLLGAAIQVGGVPSGGTRVVVNLCVQNSGNILSDAI